MILQGKVVLVTGASRGIGRALAVGFAADGASVVAFARSAHEIHETTHGDTEHFLMVVGDVTSEADVDRLVATTYARFGQIDVLVNNAGIGNQGALLARPFSEWADVIRVNLIGLALCTHRVLPGMITRGYGRVINLASRAAEFPRRRCLRMGPPKPARAELHPSAGRGGGTAEPSRYSDQCAHPRADGHGDDQTGRVGPSSAWQAPEAVYPHTRFLVTLPPGGPHGRVFWNSKEYTMYAAANELQPRPKN